MEISVVIPVYNRADMIVRALDSLVNQTYKDFEVLIIDDGSKDTIKQVVDQYAGNLDIAYYYYDHSGNIAYLRNQGMNRAKGKYVAILDSDDWCSDNRLELQIRYFNKNPKCDILATWVNIIDECNSPNSRRIEQLYNMHGDRKTIERRCLNEGSCLCNSTVMFNKNRILDLGGYDESMPICEDFNLWLRALSEGYVIDILDEKLVYRVLHNNSVTSGYNGADESVRLVIRNKLQYLKSTGKLDRKPIIWGINKRDNLLLEELKPYGIEKIKIVDIDNEMPYEVDCNAYHLVTSFSRQKSIFEYLDKNNLQIVDEYIYI